MSSRGDPCLEYLLMYRILALAVDTKGAEFPRFRSEKLANILKQRIARLSSNPELELVFFLCGNGMS